MVPCILVRKVARCLMLSPVLKGKRVGGLLGDGKVIWCIPFSGCVYSTFLFWGTIMQHTVCLSILQKVRDKQAVSRKTNEP
jgi:hypothetical protein